MTVAERIKLVWPLTVAAWAFSGNPWDESRLRRDVERVVRRERWVSRRGGVLRRRPWRTAGHKGFRDLDVRFV